MTSCQAARRGLGDDLDREMSDAVLGAGEKLSRLPRTADQALPVSTGGLKLDLTTTTSEIQGLWFSLTISTEISTAGIVPLFSSQCVVFLSSGHPTPGPYSVATPFRWSVIVP